MRVLETLWFTGINGCIGIVVGEEDVTGDRKAYIGVASGANEKADQESILGLGNKFTYDIVQRLDYYLKPKTR